MLFSYLQSYRWTLNFKISVLISKNQMCLLELARTRFSGIHCLVRNISNPSFWTSCSSHHPIVQASPALLPQQTLPSIRHNDLHYSFPPKSCPPKTSDPGLHHTPPSLPRNESDHRACQAWKCLAIRWLQVIFAAEVLYSHKMDVIMLAPRVRTCMFLGAPAPWVAENTDSKGVHSPKSIEGMEATFSIGHVQNSY